MKRTLSFMVMALALLLTQCRKPEVKFPTPSSAEGVTVSMTVTAGPGSKTDITDEGAITWSEGDKLYVGDGAKYIGFLTLVGDGGSATGTFTGNVTLPEGTPQTFHFFYLGSVDYTGNLKKGESTTVDVDFSSQNIYADVNNKADVNKKLVNASAQHVGYGSANGTVTNGVVTGINVTLVSKVAIAYFDFKNNDGTDYTEALTLSGDNIYNKMTVNFNSRTGFSFSGTEGDIALGSGNAERYVMLVPVGTESETLSFAGDGVLGSTTLGSGIEPNKFYGKTEPIPVNLTAPAPTTHVFSVAAGTTVEFAPGNLWADATGATPVFHFEANQWSVANTWDPSYVSHFWWSKDAAEAIKGEFNWDQPMSTEDVFFTEASDFQVDGETAGSWRTLTKDEWVWLLGPKDSPDPGSNCRTSSTINGTANARYAEVKVNGVSGMMVFPDVFAWPSDVSTTPLTFNTNSSDWNDVDYSTTDFGKLESAGVVFLPAAGRREGTSLDYFGSDGNYWSSTYYESDFVYYLYFVPGSVDPCNVELRDYGSAVRLVRDVAH